LAVRSIASLSLSLGAIALSKKAKQEIEVILESLLKRPQLKKAVSQKPAGWTPNPLPKPLIEEPVKTVSENVIELPKQKSSIDEIMRRRRVS